MKIVGIHSHHDGGIATAIDGELTIYAEASKDGQRRYAGIDAMSRSRMSQAAQLHEQPPPDVFAHGGWFGGTPGYFGVNSSSVVSRHSDDDCLGEFATTHERAHILCAYALSPFRAGEPCYCLVYEGMIGAFYYIDSSCNITCLCRPMTEPGHRYAALFELADPAFPDDSHGMSAASAGKLMALATPQDPTKPLTKEEEALVKLMLAGRHSRANSRSIVLEKGAFRELPYWNGGHLSSAYRQLAWRFSDSIFEHFYSAAKEIAKERLPLLISGGCGLNCNWNTKWRSSGLFQDVFVPPCPDDSGIAIGVVADAQRFYTGNPKLRWSVYSGEPFYHDVEVPNSFEKHDLELEFVVQLLQRQAVIAWVQGRYEIGPRALGNRSLLAAPFTKAMTARLNDIKKRESYRPIAPICLEEEVSRWFEWSGQSEYMLYFQKVKTDRIPAVTHDDDTARVQTVGPRQNPRLYQLLRLFSEATGVGVLCNTSLNFPSHGFINRTSDLLRYVVDRGIDAFVLQDHVFVNRSRA